MSVPTLTYTELTAYFRDAALAHTVAISPGQILSALDSLLGSTSSNGGFTFGTSPVDSAVTASLTAAQASVSQSSATAARFDAADTALTQLGAIVGTAAPSASGPSGDATTLPVAGTSTLPDTLQGNIDRAQRAVGLPTGRQQAQEETAAQLRFDALRGQAQQLVAGLQSLPPLSSSANQSVFDTAIGALQAALASSAVDPNRVGALSFSPATGGGVLGGSFDASTSAGRGGARAAVSQLARTISAAQAALAPARSVVDQQLTSAQSLVTQLTNLQAQVKNSSFSLGNSSTSAFTLFQFPRSGLTDFFV